jgi:hypothetical protein
MPTLLTSCPQCDRPLALDLAADGPSINCPCCDRRIDVPAPQMRNAPATVWLAAAAAALFPLSLLYGVLTFAPSEVYALGLLPFAVGFLVLAIGVLRGSLSAWTVSLALASAAGLVACGAALFGMPTMLVMGGAGWDLIVSAVPVAGAAVVVVVFLLTPGCRAWCLR